MKKTIRFTLKAKDCTKEFKDGMGAGILAFKDFEYNLKPEEFKSAMFGMELIEREKEFLEEIVEVVMEEI